MLLDILYNTHRISNSVGVPKLAVCACSELIRQLVYYHPRVPVAYLLI